MSIKRVNKSRKEYVCSKCGEVIPTGSSYIRGQVNFGPTIIRCESCGLKSYEVTTSEYVRSVGHIVEDWRESYSSNVPGIDDLVSDLEEIRSDLEEKLDNMPDGLRDGDVGCLLADRIDNLNSAISDLESIDESEVMEEVWSMISDDFDEEDEDNWNGIDAYLSDEDIDTSEAEAMLDEGYGTLIDEALSNLEY